MSIAFVAESHTASGGTDLTVTVAKPTGTADGDLVVVCLTNINNQTYTPPEGWTLRAVTSNGDSVLMSVYSKVAASEGASWDFTQGGEGAWGWVAVAYRGADASTPVIDASAGAAYITSDATLWAESVSTARATDLVVWFGAYAYDLAGGPMTADPSGFTERIDWESTAVHLRMWAGDKTFSVGATGSVTATVTSAVTYKDARMLVLQEPGGATYLPHIMRTHIIPSIGG